MYAASVLNSMLGKTTTGVIPTELLPIDRIMQRWDSAHRGGRLMTQEEIEVLAALGELPQQSLPPPLDDDTTMVVDDIVRDLPPQTKRLTIMWYRRPLPTTEIARQIGVSDRSVERHWLLALNFLRWKFLESRDLTLSRLMGIRA